MNSDASPTAFFVLFFERGQKRGRAISACHLAQTTAQVALKLYQKKTLSPE